MNEKGVGLIEIVFVLILFTAVLPMSLYYVSLSKTISDSILLGELMDSYVSDIKMKYKTGFVTMWVIVLRNLLNILIPEKVKTH